VTWKPNVTVAAVVLHQGRFLIVEEMAGGRRVLNQPAGHLERGESLLAAVRRETLEETGWLFEPEALLGIYRWAHREKATTYLRFAFTGRLLSQVPGHVLDTGIVDTLYLTPEELSAEQHRHRSPQVQACANDYLGGQRFPLQCLRDFDESLRAYVRTP